jgi:hypothetical protein
MLEVIAKPPLLRRQQRMNTATVHQKLNFTSNSNSNFFFNHHKMAPEKLWKTLLWEALGWTLLMTFSCGTVLIVLLAAECFELPYLTPFAFWLKAHTKLLWVSIYYIGWALEPFKPIIAPVYTALCVRAWRRGMGLAGFLYVPNLTLDAIFDILVRVGLKGKRKMEN